MCIVSVDTLDGAAKTLRAPAPSQILVADSFSADQRALLFACVAAAENDETLPLDEYSVKGFTPGQVVAREWLLSREPEFVVLVDGDIVGGWRGRIGGERGVVGWIVGLAEGEVRCDFCDSFLSSTDRGDHEQVCCKRCAAHMAAEDDR